MIRSVYYNQTEIIASIMQLHHIDCFDADITFGNGKFWDDLPMPKLKFDIDPQIEGVQQASSVDLPIESNSINSVMFDPPFLTYVRQGRNHNNGSMIMSSRFGGYWTYNELETHYTQTIKESFRVLRKKGILTIKCQDIVHNHKLHATHINVVNWAHGFFRLKDLFILPVKNRMAIPQQKNTAKKKQRHARIFHSYFMVLERL